MHSTVAHFTRPHTSEEPARGGGELRAVQVAQGARGREVGKERAIEERQRAAELRLLLVGQRLVDVRGELIAPNELVERGVRRVDGVAEVDGAVEVAVARFDAQRGEKEPARLPDRERPLPFGFTRLAQAEVAADREMGDRVERGGLCRGLSGPQEQQREGGDEDGDGRQQEVSAPAIGIDGDTSVFEHR